MIKYLKFIVSKNIMFIMFGSMISLLTNAQENNLPDRKYSLGGGFTNGFDTYHEQYGGNIKFDYYLNNKLSFGIRTVVCGNKGFSHFVKDSFQYSGFKAISGYILNVSLVGNYYLFGNGFSSRWGCYFTGGISYSLSQQLYNGYHLYSPPISFTISTIKYSNLSALVGIGGDLKVGSGRVYLEIPIRFPLFGNGTEETSDVPGSIINKSDKTFNSNSSDFGPIINDFVFINIGYIFLF